MPKILAWSLLLAWLLRGTVCAQEPVRWVDFDVPVAALETAMELDVDSQGQEISLDWADILALAATHNGGGRLSPAQVCRSGRSVGPLCHPFPGGSVEARLWTKGLLPGGSRLELYPL